MEKDRKSKKKNHHETHDDNRKSRGEERIYIEDNDGKKKSWR